MTDQVNSLAQSQQIDEKYTEKEKLVPIDIAQEKIQHYEGKTQIPMTNLNLLNCIIGVGVMTLPYNLQTDGYIFGICVFVLMGWFTHMSFSYIAEASEYTRHFNYKEIAEDLFHHKAWGYIVPIIIIIYTAGSLISYSIALMDNMFWWSANTSNNQMYKEITCVCVMFLVMYPLSCMRSISFLKYNAYITIVCELIICTVIVAYFFFFKSPHNAPVMYTGGFNVFTSFPLFSASMCGHMAAPYLYKELENRSLPRINTVFALNSVILLTIYSLIMLFGYFTFTNLLQSDVLKTIAQYASNQWYLALANCCQLVLIVFHFPATCFGQRVAIETLIWRESKTPLWGTFLVCFIALAIFVIIALFVPSISDVLDVTSSLCGSFVILAIPACFALVVRYRQKKHWNCFVLPGAVALLGLLQFVTGFTSTAMTW